MALYDSKADFKVHEMKSMGKSRDTEAMDWLKRISHQVQPIMRRREWRVPLLSEFFPANPNLLGLNIGGGGGRTREIKVRLRPARDPDSFLPYESVLGTMLHELVHNVRGPHDGAFYKLLDEITAECEELMSRGVGGTGVGFDGPSCGRLGSHAFIPLHNPEPGRLRDAALKAAEERAKRQRIMPAGPRRLGGGDGAGRTLRRYATPAEAAAAAAERRCSDNRWCPCERLAGVVNRAVAQAEAEAARQREAARGGGAGFGGAPGSGSAGSAAGAASAAPAASAPSIPFGGGPSAAPGPSHTLHSRPPPPPLRPPPTAAEVEADIIRRIEDGVIDLTLDDSDSEPESESEPELKHDPTQQRKPESGSGLGSSGGAEAAPMGPTRGADGALQGASAGDGWRPSGGPRQPPQGASAAAAVAAGGRGGGGLSGIGAEGASAGGERGGGRLRLGPSVDGGAVGGRGAAAGDAAGPAPGGPSGPAARKRERLNDVEGVRTAPAAVKLEQQQRAAPQPPQPVAPRPPLQVLQPRNPAAAAAAAAALARMQQQSQQPPPLQPAVSSGVVASERRQRQECQRVPAPQRQRQGIHAASQPELPASALPPGGAGQGVQRQQPLPPPLPPQQQQQRRRVQQQAQGRGVGAAAEAAVGARPSLVGGGADDVIDLTED
ncbi:hypothetical protein PLESTM_000773000 [Pleodorina starrii]|nr:hypothetical protein PLESTM_000773000 [Pleodorina starrii]